MKKILFVIIVLFLLIIIFNPKTLNCFTLYNYKELNDAFFPRDEGSLNEKRLVKYIENFCNSYDLKYKTNKINDNENIITNSFNIEIYLKSNNIDEEQLVIVCPLNNAIINRKNYDNSLSIQIMLELIKKCKEIPFKKDLIFLFSGSNERENSNYDGINFFIKKSENLNKSFVTVINLLNNKNKIIFSGSSNRKPIPHEILKRFFNVTNNFLNIKFSKNEIYKARFFFLSNKNYIFNFTKNDIPCVSFSNNETAENEGSVDKKYQIELINYFYEWLNKIDDIKLPLDTDYHYQYINLFGIKILIPEIIQILFILAIIILIIIIRLFFPGFQKLHIKLFIKSLPYFIIILLIYISLSFIPLAIFLPISYLTGITKSFLNFPLLYFINILTIPSLIILILYKLIIKIPFPKHSYLYVFGAFSFSLINLIIFSIFDISFSYIYLWAIIIISISQYTQQNIKLKFLFYSISIAPLFLLIINLSQISNLDPIKDINIFILNITFSFFTFPFILLFIRMGIIIKSKFKLIIHKEIHFSIIMLMMIFLIISSIIISTARPPGEKIVKAELYSDVNKKGNYLSLSSDSVIGNIKLKYNKELIEYNIFKNNKNILLTNKINNQKPYEITFKKTGSNYIKLNFNIKSKYIIEYLKIYLITPKNISPIDSNLIIKKTDSFSKDFDHENNEIYYFLIPRNTGKNFSYNIELIKNNYRFLFKFEYPFIKDSVLSLNKSNAIINNTNIFVEEIIID